MSDNEKFSLTNEDQHNDSRQNKQSLVIPVIEETARIDKQVITTGKIKIEKQIEEINEAVNISLQHDEYTIKRVTINKYVDEETPQVRYEGNTMIIPVLKEVVVKRMLLVEEVHIIKEVISAEEQVNIPLRKEKVTVTRSADNQDSPVQS
ncbi:DUF2382 domain-containing protein [Ilyomonas limi]|uniref:DUF2382 domain-containing protein n=1 Tax=Ilyomonas limi TaxID=2575867 RepID=A0A4U3L562_9BACT|nr:YsnF/AvaK domain-containing protein [Ilyomonas limi]TKK68816.1 DUF2382 domain-containing protein [Ilyomonas limi]